MARTSTFLRFFGRRGERVLWIEFAWVSRSWEVNFPMALCLLGLLLLPVRAIDQTGAEKAKIPKAVQVIECRDIPGSSYKIGNVEVTYEDGSRDRWTRLRFAMLPQVAGDGTVGWVDCGNRAKKGILLNRRGGVVPSALVLCHRGNVIARIRTALPYIEDWFFENDGGHVVVISRASHGPATIERFVRENGSRVAEISAYESKVLPAWAQRP
jgi:hypothetical protein